MSTKHEVPGSSPGGSNNSCGAIAQGLEHAFHQLLSSQLVFSISAWSARPLRLCGE